MVRRVKSVLSSGSNSGLEVSASKPDCSNNDSPDCASRLRQICWARFTMGTYCAPSPTDSRVMRVSPWLEPKVCGGWKRSMPTTSTPALAN
ncbi:hypothetical protein D3C81_2040340 [compost metagenome]